MRAARTKNGLGVEGDVIIPYRSPASIQAVEDQTLSFQDWTDNDPLPEYQDHVSGYTLNRPVGEGLESTPPHSDQTAFVYPDNPAFGPPSVVKTPGVPKVSRRVEDKARGEGCDDKFQHASEVVDQDMEDANDAMLAPTRMNPKRNLKAHNPPVKIFHTTTC